MKNIPIFYKIIDFQQKNDNGTLINVYENIPFDVKRVYTIRGIKAYEIRGKHAHHATQQMLVVLSGACKVILDDGLSTPETVELSRPTKGVLINPYVWHTMQDFSDDTTILVLASAEYDKKDYIRDYSEFLAQLPIEGVPGY